MSPTSPLNFAIVGPGGIADDQHAPILAAHPDACLWSVVSRSLDRARSFAGKHGAEARQPAFDSLDECLADDQLDAVIITTPDRLHEEHTIAAARAGKNILLEKPMSVDPASCDRMIQACETAGVTFGVAYHLRWHVGHRLVRDLVTNGALGPIRHMRVLWTFQAPDGTNWRSSPKTGRWWSLAANGTHCLDLIRWMLCSSEGEIERIQALTSNAKFGSPHDETAMVSFRFASGAMAEICVSVQFASDSRIEIHGDDGWIRMEATMGRHGRGSVFHNGKTVHFEPVSPFNGELDDFIRAIREGRPPEVDGVEGRRNVELLTEASISAGASFLS